MEAWQTIMMLGAVAIVCAAVLPRKAVSNNDPTQSSQTVRNMETALESFMENMESENRQMVEMVTKSQQETQTQAVNREKRISELEKRCADLEAVLTEQAKGAARSIVSEHAAASPLTANSEQQALASTSIVSKTANVEEPAPTIEESTIRSRYSDLFEMYSHGKSIEAIAKKLGINKGEVQLILQLSKQEEAGRDE
jgi:hypothetical protein